MKRLLERNADPLMRDNEDMTAFMYAARRRNSRMFLFAVGSLILAESLKRALQPHNPPIPRLEPKKSSSCFPYCPDFSWLCMDTEDKFVDFFEYILTWDSIRTAAEEFVSFSKHVRIQNFKRSPNLVTKVLSELVDRSGRRIIDAATPKIRDCMHKRLLFLGRYELDHDGLPTHSSKTSTVILALDRQPHVLYVVFEREARDFFHIPQIQRQHQQVRECVSCILQGQENGSKCILRCSKCGRSQSYRFEIKVRSDRSKCVFHKISTLFEGFRGNLR